MQDFYSPPPCAMLLFSEAIKARIAAQFKEPRAEIWRTFMSTSILVRVRRVGTIADVGDSYADYLVRGMFKANARLLRKVSELIWYNYFRVDYRTDVVDCAMDVEYPSCVYAARRSDLRYSLVFSILLQINQDYQ